MDIPGLVNLGNTCYLNSIIQCLINCDLLINYLNSNNFLIDVCENIDLEKNIEKEMEEVLIFQFYKLVKTMFNDKNKVFKPISFKNILGKKLEIFDNYSQNDSQELLVFILDKLGNEIKKDIILKPLNIDDINLNKIEKLYKEDKQLLLYTIQNDYKNNIKILGFLYNKYELTKNYSYIDKLFYGLFLTERICEKTNKISFSFEQFDNIHIQATSYLNDMKLYEKSENESDSSIEDDNFINNKLIYNESDLSDNELENSDSDSDSSDNIFLKKIYNIKIIDLLDFYFKEQKIEKYLSPFCNELVNAKIKLSIWNLPQFLTIHFVDKDLDIQKRYSNNEIKIEFEEKIDLTKFVNDNNKNGKKYEYELISVNNRISFGNENNGHFYSCCKKKNKWYKIEDEEVTEISFNDCKKYSYILFYKIINHD